MSRRTTLLVALGAAVLLGLGIAVGLLIGTSDGDTDETSAAPVDRSNPRAVATAFITRYATGDPAACALVTAEVRSEMQSAGRCQGQVRGHADPSITYLRTVLCPPGSPTASSLYARVKPSGEIGKPYIRVSLSNSGAAWSVSRISTWSTPPSGQAGRCKPAPTEFGG